MAPFARSGLVVQRLKGDGSEKNCHERIITLLRFDYNDEVIGDRRGILAGSQNRRIVGWLDISMVFGINGII